MTNKTRKKNAATQARIWARVETARLFGAAADLLRACEEAIGPLESKYPDSVWVFDMRAAIKKARGV